MTRISLTFTNNNEFAVVLDSVAPSSTQEIREGEVAAATRGPQLSTFSRDIPIGTEWRMKTSAPETFFDIYHTTSDASQFYVIRDCRTQLSFRNDTASTVFLFSVDPVSKQESKVGSIEAGRSTSIKQPKGALFP